MDHRTEEASLSVINVPHNYREEPAMTARTPVTTAAAGPTPCSLSHTCPKQRNAVALLHTTCTAHDNDSTSGNPMSPLISQPQKSGWHRLLRLIASAQIPVQRAAAVNNWPLCPCMMQPRQLMLTTQTSTTLRDHTVPSFTTTLQAHAISLRLFNPCRVFTTTSSRSHYASDVARYV